MESYESDFRVSVRGPNYQSHLHGVPMRVGIIGGYGHLGSILIARIAGEGTHTAVAIGVDDHPKDHEVDLWVIAVPPQDMEGLLGSWCGDETAPILTFAAGLPLSYYHSYGCTNVVRAMTNIAAFKGQAMSVWIADEDMSEAANHVRFRSRIYGFFEMLGPYQEVTDEGRLDTATALIGSGIAYAMRIFQDFVDFGIEDGLLEDDAILWAQGTFTGLLSLLPEYTELEDAINEVASPNGTTEKGLEMLADQGASDTLKAALRVTADRCRELGSLK